MKCKVFEMDPRDKRLVTVDFSQWLGTSTINTAVWVVPSGLTNSDEGTTTTTAYTYFESVNDQAENEYEVICEITTNDAVSREKNQRFLLRVEKNC